MTYKFENISFYSPFVTGYMQNDRIKGIYGPVDGSNKAIILLHGYTMSKKDMDSLMYFFNTEDYSSFAMDLPFHGDRTSIGVDRELVTTEKLRFCIQQAVNDISLVAEFLHHKGNRSISLFGYSLGAMISFVALANDRRLNKAMCAYGGADIADLVLNSPITESLRGNFEESLDYDFLKDNLINVEPINYAKDVDSSKVYFVNGKEDEIVFPKNTLRLINSMGSMPEIDWLDGGHYPNTLDPQLRKFVKMLNM